MKDKQKMKKIIICLILVSVLIVLGCTTLPQEKEPIKPTEKPECTTTPDCIIGGCSGTLCHAKGENIYTTCEYLPEYDCYRLINCGCVNNKCQWEKNSEFEKCLQEKKS